MKPLLVAALAIYGAIPCAVNAQRGGAHGGAMGRPGFGSGNFLPGKGGIGRDRGFFDHGFGFNNRGFGLNNRGGFSGLGFGYGWGDGGYSGLYEESWFPQEGNQTSPNMVMLPMQAPVQPLPPPQPARPVMQIYHWAESGGDPQANFSIVSRDGVVHQAAAVWLQDSDVRYTTANGGAGRMALAAVDCEATNRLNAQHQLSLRLPGCKASQ